MVDLGETPRMKEQWFGWNRLFRPGLPCERTQHGKGLCSAKYLRRSNNGSTGTACFGLATTKERRESYLGLLPQTTKRSFGRNLLFRPGDG